MRTRLVGSLLILVLAPAIAGAQGVRARAPGDTSTWAGLSGQWRLRGESWSGFGAGAPAGTTVDGGFGLSRVLLRGEGRLRGRLGLVAELKSSLVTNRVLPGGRRLADEDVFDLQQLYGEATVVRPVGRALLRVGRFDLSLGRERLVSPLDWTNTRRAFQGAAFTFARRSFELRLLAVRPIQIRRRQPNIADTTRQLYGAQLAHALPPGRLELYWLRNENGSAGFNGTAGYERRHTIGARFTRAGAPRQPDADVEVAMQRGSVGGSPVRAWMLGSQVGWTFASRAAPRVYAGLDAASGDRAAGGSVETFNQLFPLGHAFLGYIDLHGRENIVDLNAGGSVRALYGMLVQLDVHDFTRNSSADALYAADGSVARAPGTGLPGHVGTELDLTLKRSVDGGTLLFQAGASHYFAGSFLRAAGSSRNITWVYAQTTVSF